MRGHLVRLVLEEDGAGAGPVGARGSPWGRAMRLEAGPAAARAPDSRGITLA